MQAMEESQKQLEEIKKALSDNGTHIQLSNLERRWQVVSPIADRYQDVPYCV